MNKKCTGVIIVALGLLTGCIAVHPEVDQRSGEAITAARAAQTFDAQASLKPRPVAGIEGLAAKETADRYVQSFKSPPPVTNVINIGGGIAGN